MTFGFTYQNPLQFIYQKVFIINIIVTSRPTGSSGQHLGHNLLLILQTRFDQPQNLGPRDYQTSKVFMVLFFHSLSLTFLSPLKFIFAKSFLFTIEFFLALFYFVIHLIRISISALKWLQSKKLQEFQRVHLLFLLNPDFLLIIAHQLYHLIYYNQKIDFDSV